MFSKQGKMMNIFRIFVSTLIFSFLVGCDRKESCGCTLEAIGNFCLKVNGSSTLPESFAFIREKESNPPVFDTLRTQLSNCFAGVPGKQRVLVYSADSLVYQSDWINVDATGCCSVPEAKTVDMPL
jgi:hypothetical protein